MVEPRLRSARGKRLETPGQFYTTISRTVLVPDSWIRLAHLNKQRKPLPVVQEADYRAKTQD